MTVNVRAGGCRLNQSVNAAQSRDETETFTSESILSIYPRCSNPPAPAGHKRTCYRTVLLLVEAFKSKEKVQKRPFPEALCVWTGCPLRFSPLHPESSCGAPPQKR